MAAPCYFLGVLYYEGPAITVSGMRTIKAVNRWCHDELPGVCHRQGVVTPYENLVCLLQARRPRQLAVRRTYALGDVLMLLPVLRALRRSCDSLGKVVIVTGHQIADSLITLNQIDPDLIIIRDRGWVDYGADVHIDLNGVLEADHRGGEASNHHRVRLYARSIGMELA